MGQWSRNPVVLMVMRHLGYAPIALTEDDFDEEELRICEPDDDGYHRERSLSEMLRKASACICCVGSFLRLLLPSFFHAATDGAEKRPLHPTAWLDGLRGLAAFTVVMHHFTLVFFSMSIHNAWGSSEARYFIQLPFIRLFVSGLPAVLLFFVISGYCLSYKPLKLIRQGRHAEFMDALSSSAFRRHSRLFIPPAATTFLIAWISYFGVFEIPTSSVAVPPTRPPRFDTVGAQFMDWGAHIVQLADPIAKAIDRGRGFAYDPTLWTLPVEFDCSLVVFMALAAFSKLRPRVRLAMNLGVVLFALYYTYWQQFLFLSGMFLADLNFHLQEDTSGESINTADSCAAPLPSSSRFSLGSLPLPVCMAGGPKSSMFRKALGITAFILTVYVLSMPDYGPGVGPPGFATLWYLTPAQYAGSPGYFWTSIAAVLVVFSVDRTPSVQFLFSNPFSQYLGRISYALYLVHSSLLWILAWPVGHYFTGLSGVETDGQYGVGIALTACFFFPGVIWVADLVQRYVDANAVKFGKWLEGKLT